MSSECTPRQSNRLRKKSKRKFRMPSRDDILDSIEASPYKQFDHLKPRRIINNFTKEHNSYNNRLDLPELSEDEESLSDFIIDDTPTISKPKRRKKVKEERIKRQRVRTALDSESDEEATLQNSQRQSARIKKRPKREFHKPDRKEALEKIIEKEPDMKYVIDSDDAEDFVEETDCEEEITSDEEKIISVDETTSADERARVTDGATVEEERGSNDHYQTENLKGTCSDDNENYHENASLDQNSFFGFTDNKINSNRSRNAPRVQSECIDSNEEVESGWINSHVKLEPDQMNTHVESDCIDSKMEPDDVCSRVTIESGQTSLQTCLIISHESAKIDSHTKLEPSGGLNSGTPGNERSPSLEHHQSSVNRKVITNENTEVEKKSSLELVDSSDSEPEIRVGNCLRSKVHHRSQQSKALDSENSDSENEVNVSFAKREQKRKVAFFNSDEDSDE